MLEFTVARALHSDDVLLAVQDVGRVIFEKSCRCILDDVFVVRDTTLIVVDKKPTLFTYCCCEMSFCIMPLVNYVQSLRLGLSLLYCY